VIFSSYEIAERAPYLGESRLTIGGPYWYLYYTNEKTGRYTSRYEGKTLRPELAQEFGLPPGSTAVREGGEDQEGGDRVL
jgi:hypothetical protein